MSLLNTKKMDKEIQIKREQGFWTCSDGCCFEWYEGVTVTLNGEVIFSIPCEREREVDEESMYIKILNHLGYTVSGDVDCLY